MAQNKGVMGAAVVPIKKLFDSNKKGVNDDVPDDTMSQAKETVPIEIETTDAVLDAQKRLVETLKEADTSVRSAGTVDTDSSSSEDISVFEDNEAEIDTLEKYTKKRYDEFINSSIGRVMKKLDSEFEKSFGQFLDEIPIATSIKDSDKLAEKFIDYQIGCRTVLAGSNAQPIAVLQESVKAMQDSIKRMEISSDLSHRIDLIQTDISILRANTIKSAGSAPITIPPVPPPILLNSSAGLGPQAGPSGVFTMPSVVLK